MWLLTKDFQLFFGLIIGLASLTQLNAICQTISIKDTTQEEIKISEDDFSRIAEKINNKDGGRSRASTLNSIASNNTQASMVSSNTSMVSLSPSPIGKGSMVSTSPTRSNVFDFSLVLGVDEESLQSDAHDDDNFQ